MTLQFAEKATHKAPRPAWFGKTVHAMSSIDPSVELPRHHKDWRELLQPRQFAKVEGVSAADTFRASSTINHITFGGQLIATTTKDKMPPQPTSSTEYFAMCSRLAKFLVATGRFNDIEARSHHDHVGHVMGLFDKFPIADVMIYDDEFRLTRHRLCDGKWSTPDSALLTLRIHTPVTERAAAAAAKPPAGGGGGGKPPKTAPTKPPTKPAKKDPWARPCYVNKESGGVALCQRWLWGGCADPCNHTSYRGAAAPLAHQCSFCTSGPTDHRLTECAAYKAAHPADFAKGIKG
jgi:hypothetical protein